MWAVNSSWRAQRHCIAAGFFSGQGREFEVNAGEEENADARIERRRETKAGKYLAFLYYALDSVMQFTCNPEGRGSWEGKTVCQQCWCCSPRVGEEIPCARGPCSTGKPDREGRAAAKAFVCPWAGVWPCPVPLQGLCWRVWDCQLMAFLPVVWLSNVLSRSLGAG